MRQCCRRPSNHVATQGLIEYLMEHNVIAIEGIDTRELTRRVRIKGVMNAAISTLEPEPSELISKARNWKGLEGVDLVREVTCNEPYVVKPSGDIQCRVVAYDFGIKRNIIKKLAEAGCEVTVVPANTPSSQTLALDPDGIFLSNGPGDPRAVGYAIQITNELITSGKPIFGHRGANQQIKELATNRTLITSENHGWGISSDNLPDCLEITRQNLNDGCVEGIHHRELPIFSIQCHPEAAPGPHDSFHLFAYFTELMQKHAA